MLARQAGLLTPSKSAHPRRLLFYKIRSSAASLDATLPQVLIPNNFIPFGCNTFEKPGEGWGVMVNQLFLWSNSSLPPTSHLPYTLPSSVSCIPFICHSYKNTRGVVVFFPFWNSSLSHLQPSLFFLTANFQLSIEDSDSVGTVSLPPGTSHQSQVASHQPAPTWSGSLAGRIFPATDQGASHV